ncbi:MAG: glycosyltransferase family 2 protein [Rikenellaceae bacterium]
MIKVSVVIPIYNTEPYLAECLASVVNQTLCEIEIICVNDGSTDGSYGIIYDFAARDSRIVVVNNRNEGGGATRNIGLAIATGASVLFFDSDDYMEPETLEKMYGQMESDSSDVVVCRSNNIEANGDDLGLIHNSINRDLIGRVNSLAPSDFARHIFQIFIGWPWDKLYRRNFLEQHGLQFQNLLHSDDTFFVLTSLVLARRISCVEESFMRHRRRNDSMSASTSRLRDPACFVVALERMYEVMNEAGIYDIYAQSFLNYCVSFPKWHYETICSQEGRDSIDRCYLRFAKRHKLHKMRNTCFYVANDFKWLHARLSDVSNARKIFDVRNVAIDMHIYKQITILGATLRFRNKKRERIRAVQ